MNAVRTGFQICLSSPSSAAITTWVFAACARTTGSVSEASLFNRFRAVLRLFFLISVGVALAPLTVILITVSLLSESLTLPPRCLRERAS